MIKETELLRLHAKSVFAPYMIDFIEQKRALGFKYNSCVEVLNMFDDFCRENEVTETVFSKELFEKWCRKKANENETTLMMRVNYVQIFSKYLHNNGIDAPASFHPLPKKSKEFIAYIFSEEEILRFIQTVDRHNTKPIIGSPVKHLVHPVLFRVLYGCGLRINEALKLKIGDVDFKNGTMLIRAAKGDKDRMVVLSDSLAKICTEYRSNDAICSFESEYFFPCPDHGYYDSSTIYADFRKYLLLSKIPHRGRGKGPRLHDFRHTFAVHVLNSWARQGKDLYTYLPILQVYLGHSKLSSTEKYLRLVPDAYMQLTETFEEKINFVFPEVQNENR